MAVWFAVRHVWLFASGWLAVLVGAFIGGAVVRAADRSGIWPALLAAALTVLAAILAQNFVQRDQLQDGIETLQADWANLKKSAGSATPSAADAPLERPFPPPAIAPLLPVEALLTIPPNGLAQIWQYVKPETKAKLPTELVAQVEALVAGGASPEGKSAMGDATTSSTKAATSAAVEANFNIPRPVLKCAPAPDFTQPTAAAGLGFPSGVPLILPLSDYYRTAPPRGDGVEAKPPSAVCFARESAKDDPLEAVFWLLGLAVAVAVAGSPILRRRRPTKCLIGP